MRNVGAEYYMKRSPICDGGSLLTLPRSRLTMKSRTGNKTVVFAVSSVTYIFAQVTIQNGNEGTLSRSKCKYCCRDVEIIFVNDAKIELFSCINVYSVVNNVFTWVDPKIVLRMTKNLLYSPPGL